MLQTVLSCIVSISCTLAPCAAVPSNYLPGEDSTLGREELVAEYFHHGFSYLEILTFLVVTHGISLSIRQLKRILKKLQLFRRKEKHDISIVVAAVENELQETGGDLGYRAMYHRVQKKYHINTDRESIRLILHHLDPAGVELRRQRRLKRREYHVPGPNYLWHIDGWDKLKPYGLCIHGCIDGYSRRVMWLEVSPSNKNPAIIGRYYSRCIQELKGVPKTMRADRGTENVHVEAMHTLLTCNGELEVANLRTTFLYGKSTSNQRIEAWWSKFKQQGMNTWIQHFKDLDDRGIIDTSMTLHIECIQFCYMDLLRVELYDIMTLWNTHHLRRNRFSSAPSGKPDVMYHLPMIFNSEDYLLPLNLHDHDFLEELLTVDISDCDSHYRNLFEEIMAQKQLRMPNGLTEADKLLTQILDTIDSLMEYI